MFYLRLNFFKHKGMNLIYYCCEHCWMLDSGTASEFGFRKNLLKEIHIAEKVGSFYSFHTFYGS